MRTPDIARASARPYVNNSQVTFDVSFLGQLSSPMKAPEIEYITLRAKGTAAIAAGKTVAGKSLLINLISRFFATDITGDVISMGGASLRQWAQRMLGAGYLDPPDLAGGGGGANVDFDVQLTIPFVNRKGQQADDYRKPVSDFLGNGGQFRWQTGTGALRATDATSTSTITAAATTLEIWAGISDAGVPRAGSRLQLRDYAVNGQDFRYPVQGLLLEAWISAQANDIIDGTALTAQSYISDKPFYASYDNSVLDKIYERYQYSLAASDDVVAGVAQSFYTSSIYQAQSEAPDIDLMQIRMSTTPPTGGQVCIASVTQRQPAQVAAALGVPVSALPALAPSAQVTSLDGSTPRSDVPAKLATFLPVQLPSGKSA